MPRERKEARLWLKPGDKDRPAIWYIKDGSKRISLGLHRQRREEAERQLHHYRVKNFEAPTGKLGQAVKIEIVVAAYLKAREGNEFIRATALPIVEWWQGKTVAEINPTACDDYVKWRKRKVSEATARHDLKTLRAALRFYCGIDSTLIVPPIKMPPKPPPRMNYFLERDDVAARIRAARRNGQKHLVRVLLIGVYTGTRPGRIRKLMWVRTPDHGWIDLTGDTIHRIGHQKEAPPPLPHPCQAAPVPRLLAQGGYGSGGAARDPFWG
jgi:integrase